MYCRSVPLLAGNLVDGQRHEDQDARNDQRHHAEQRILEQHQRDARLRRAGGKREAAPVRLVHQGGQVLADQRQRGVGALVAGRDVVLGDHAVDQHIGDAVDGRHQHHPHEQQRHAAGQQEQDLQRRLLVDAEGELEAALARRPSPSPPPRPARPAPRAARSAGTIGPIIRLSWTLSSIRPPGTPWGMVMFKTVAGVSTNSSGRIAPLASQISQNISGSPRYLAAIRSSRSPCLTVCWPRWRSSGRPAAAQSAAPDK